MRLLSRFAFLFLAIGGLASCHDNSSPTAPNMTPTALPGIVATPTPAAAMHVVNVGQGGNNFVDSSSGTNTSTIHAGQTITWMWVSSTHSSTSGNCCTPDGRWDSGIRSGGSFTQTFSTTGSFPYFCMVHGSMMTGMVVVNP